MHSTSRWLIDEPSPPNLCPPPVPPPQTNTLHPQKPNTPLTSTPWLLCSPLSSPDWKQASLLCQLIRFISLWLWCVCARVCGCVCVTVGGGEWWARVRGLSCYNNPNRLTGKALTVEGAAACSLWKGRRDQSEGLVPEWGGGASSSRCSLTSGEGKSPAGKSVERQIGADRGGDAIGRSGRGRVDCSRNRTITTTKKNSRQWPEHSHTSLRDLQLYTEMFPKASGKAVVNKTEYDARESRLVRGTSTIRTSNQPSVGFTNTSLRW